ncbi:Beta-catenin-interacting protein 1 [Lemmus lemmus]
MATGFVPALLLPPRGGVHQVLLQQPLGPSGSSHDHALCFHRAAPSYFFSVAVLPLELSIRLPEVHFQKQEFKCVTQTPRSCLLSPSSFCRRRLRASLSGAGCSSGQRHLDTAAGLHSCLQELPSNRSPQSWARGMNREGAPGKSPEEMYIQQKVRVLLMLRKMGSNLTASEEEFLRTYAGVVSSQLSRLPQHSIDQGAEDVVMAFSRSETEDRRQ